jgi:hypothetical protein
MQERACERRTVFFAEWLKEGRKEGAVSDQFLLANVM